MPRYGLPKKRETTQPSSKEEKHIQQMKKQRAEKLAKKTGAQPAQPDIHTFVPPEKDSIVNAAVHLEPRKPDTVKK